MRAFVVEAGTPGVTVTKLEHKMGIRCSDTAAISLVDVRVPYDHILGSPTVEKTTTGFKGAMATFDATRPLVAATGIGVARAALEEVKKMLADQGVVIRYGLPRQKQTAIEKDIIDMDIMLRSAWLMVLKAVWMADNKHPNALEIFHEQGQGWRCRHQNHAEGSRAHGTTWVTAGNSCWRSGSAMPRLPISMKGPVKSTGWSWRDNCLVMAVRNCDSVTRWVFVDVQESHRKGEHLNLTNL